MYSPSRKLAPLPAEATRQSLPSGPLSHLPELPPQDTDGNVRFVNTTKRHKSAPAGGATLRPRSEAIAADNSNQASLYAFNVEELYDYDLPNIRRPSEAITALSSQKLRSPLTSRAGARLPPLENVSTADAS
eukprot:4671292-Pleurochrysis_carterae.AAC.1